MIKWMLHILADAVWAGADEKTKIVIRLPGGEEVDCSDWDSGSFYYDEEANKLIING